MKKSMPLIILAILIIFVAFVTSTAVDPPKTQPSLYSYYGNNMLFKQKDDVVLAGTAAAGDKIVAILKNSENKELVSSEAIASDDGTFTVSFVAPAGSFDEYSITMTSNGTVFDELRGVVFGELWLAGGQSNMQMGLISSKTGRQMASENKLGSDALRFFHIPYMGGTYKGKQDYMPANPLTDYEDTVGWYKGSDVKVYELSAVGYYFAENLIEELNMPVGILNANMGGTSILTWLSRETIENNQEVLADCKSDNRYIALKKWNEAKVNFSVDMTCCFNKIIAPLKNFRLSGMIWYQGEGDVAWQYGRYTRAFDALQKSYTDYFGYDSGSLPIVFTQLASYSYGSLTVLQNTNVEFAHIQQQKPESRALTSILDVPLDYTAEGHAIHPLCKKEVGDKMAYAAMGLVYGKYNTYTTATPYKTEIKNGSVFITFRDVGDKLIVDGDTIKGFSICGADGIYVSSKAEIISCDTIKVYSSLVSKPQGVAYAYSQTNNNSNLFASIDGKKTLAVSPFVTNLNLSVQHWHNDFWATCDYETFWHCHSNEFTGFYNTWNSNNATLTFNESEIDTGKALYISTDSNITDFSVSPVFTYNELGKNAYFQDVDYNWSNYGSLSFDIKVDTDDPVQFDGLKIVINKSLWVMPVIKNTNSIGLTMEGSSQKYTITLDLNRLYPYGNVNVASYSSDILSYVYSAEFVFSNSSNNSSVICFDNVDFSSVKIDSSDISNDETKATFFDKIKAFFVTVYVKIILFFQNLF